MPPTFEWMNTISSFKNTNKGQWQIIFSHPDPFSLVHLRMQSGRESLREALYGHWKVAMTSRQPSEPCPELSSWSESFVTYGASNHSGIFNECVHVELAYFLGEHALEFLTVKLTTPCKSLVVFFKLFILLPLFNKSHQQCASHEVWLHKGPMVMKFW